MNREVFKIMDDMNENSAVSRIENVEGEDLSFYRKLGYAVQDKPPDYLCSRAELAQLRGNRFGSKRASINYFIKHYEFEYLPFSLKHRDSCFRLHDFWMKGRRAANPDALYQGMLEDSRLCLKVLMNDYSSLDITGRVVSIDGEIEAFTFGFELNKDTFCVLYEVADLSIKGLPQFIFSRFCRELAGYKYINVMDDSGLENLRKAKLSYHPVKLVPAYIIARE